VAPEFPELTLVWAECAMLSGVGVATEIPHPDVVASISKNVPYVGLEFVKKFAILNIYYIVI
jgi:hypothetical protein